MNQLTQTQNHEFNTTTDMILNAPAMESMHRLAELMAAGKSTMPTHLKGSPADCMAIVMQAAQWQMNPFAVAQKTHLVNGVLGYEAQLVNAVISSSKAINGRFHYQYGGNWPNGQDAWVQVGAVLKGESDIQWGEPLFPALVTTKNSPLWKTNPKQQASYLALKYWARLYTPAVILGVYSSDELVEVDPVERDITPPTSTPEQATKSSKLNSILSAKSEPEQLSDTAIKYMRFIGNARTLEELQSVQGFIKKSVDSGDINDFERTLLVDSFSVRRRELSPIDEHTGEVVNE